MSSPKEPQFFSFDERFKLGASTHNSIFKKQQGTKYYGESSQCYFAHPWAIERIASSLDRPRAIIMLRHPIERLLSQYRWNYKRGTETDSLEDAIELRGDEVNYTFDGRVNMYRELGGYVAFSRYSKWVPLWQEALGANNVLVLRFEDFIRDEASTLLRCFRFLGVSAFEFGGRIQENTTEATTIRVLPGNLRLLAKLVPGSAKRSPFYANLKQLVTRRLTPRPVSRIDGHLTRHLEDFLQEDIAFHMGLR